VRLLLGVSFGEICINWIIFEHICIDKKQAVVSSLKTHKNHPVIKPTKKAFQLCQKLTEERKCDIRKNIASNQLSNKANGT